MAAIDLQSAIVIQGVENDTYYSPTAHSAVDGNHVAAGIVRAGITDVILREELDPQVGRPVDRPVVIGLQDVAAGIENMMLYLHAKGLASVWVGAFDEERARAALHLPEHARPVAMVPIGFPAEKGVRRRRLPLQEIMHRERWQGR